MNARVRLGLVFVWLEWLNHLGRRYINALPGTGEIMPRQSCPDNHAQTPDAFLEREPSRCAPDRMNDLKRCF
jgi:hypothetical protein